MQNNRTVGTAYEQIAGRYLEEHGYEILEYNFHCRFGEIDIIAKDKDTLVFCEVKYRKTLQAGHPFEAISFSKQRTISKCAQYYIYKKGYDDMACRFDVVGILGTEVELLKQAFDFVE